MISHICIIQSLCSIFAASAASFELLASTCRISAVFPIYCEDLSGLAISFNPNVKTPASTTEILSETLVDDLKAHECRSNGHVHVKLEKATPGKVQVRMQPHSPNRPSTSGERPNNGQVNPSIQLDTSNASINDDGLPCSHGTDDDLGVQDLVRHCCESFDSEGDPVNDFPHCFFMLNEWLMENSELLAQFVSLYQEEFDVFGERCCFAVSFWIRTFPVHFDANTQMCRLVERLKKMAIDDQLPDNICSELDVSSIPSFVWLRNASVRNPVSRHTSFAFEKWSPEELSTSLSHIDFKVLSRVTIPEIKKYVKVTKLHQTPILERSIAIFNSLSNWVQCMILSKSTPKERADVITKFVNVSKHLKKLANFNTLMAVVGGVTHSCISRLSRTQACLTAETKKDLNSLTVLLSNSNNFSNYRKALQDVDGRFRIPIMGIHLKDLIAWIGSGQNQNFDKCRTISERKLFQLGHLLSYFLGVNRASQNLNEPNMDLINTLKVSLDISYNEEDIYNLSLKREPRTLLSFQSSKPVVFADWASGVCQAPDPDTINKHISAMVDAVFKHYDRDRDAYISREEFEQIASNFPFIDSFVNIDADRDGQISKTEMKNYFLNLNRHSTEFRRGFKHNFCETTFLTPTMCCHCSKVLWGLIRQGYKCKDCGLIAHDQCKDVAVAECRRKRTTSGSSIASWLSSPRGNTATTAIDELNGSATGVSQHNSPCTSQQQRLQKKGLFLNYRNKNRTVSTVSESPSPEPPPSAGYTTKKAPRYNGNNLVAQNSTTSTASSGNGMNGILDASSKLRSSFYRLIRKSRTNSEGYYHRTHHSPEMVPENVASLATEEVFDEDSSSCCSENAQSATARSDRNQVRRRPLDGQTTVR